MEDLISYNNIKNDYEDSWKIPYDVLLNTIEWRNFREQIINRDNKICTVCKKSQSEKYGTKYYRKPNEAEIAENLKTVDFDILGDGSKILKIKKATIIGIPEESPVILHVHHTYYIFRNLPWEYEKGTLITVCHDCHANIHLTNTIRVYSDDTLKEFRTLTPCNRCNGTGFLKEYHYHLGGICFECNGRKFQEFN